MSAADRFAITIAAALRNADPAPPGLHGASAAAHLIIGALLLCIDEEVQRRGPTQLAVEEACDGLRRIVEHAILTATSVDLALERATVVVRDAIARSEMVS